MKSSFSKTILALLTLLFFSKVFGQIPEPHYEVQPSLEFLNKKKEILKTLLYSDDTGHYALFANGKFGNGKKSIRKFDLDFQPTKYRLNVGFPKKTFEPKTLKIVPFEKTIYHFWTTRTRKGIDYYVQEIDLGSQTVKTEKLIARIDYKKGYNTRTESTIVLDNNLNQLYLLSKVIHGLQENVVIRVDRYDENLEHVETQNYPLPFSNEQFKIINVKPYDDGRIILIGKNYYSRNIFKSIKRKEYDYHIYNLVNGNPILLKTISPNNKHLNNIVSKLVGEHLIITGFIDEHSLSKPSSIYFLKYNLMSSQVDVEKRNRLPDSFYSYPENRDEKIGNIHLNLRNKKREADSNYQIEDFFVNNKNEVTIVAEQNFFFESNVPITNGQGLIIMTNGKEYYSSDIVVIKVNSEGELIWHSKIIKRQQWIGSKNILSHFSVYKNNKLFLFYNGNYLNLENRYTNFLKENDAAFICTVVEDDGYFQRNVISYYTEEYPNVVLPSLSNHNNTYGAILYHRALGNLKRQKFTQVLLR